MLLRLGIPTSGIGFVDELSQRCSQNWSWSSIIPGDRVISGWCAECHSLDDGDDDDAFATIPMLVCAQQ